MMGFVQTSAYDQFLEYLAAKVSPEDILSFQDSAQEQGRLEELTEKNKADTLTPAERNELDEILAFNRLMTFLKTKAYAALKAK
jgi:hypothetical protein